VGDVNPSKNLPTLVKACVQLKMPLVLVGSKIVQKEYNKTHPENQDLRYVQQMIKKHPNLIIPTGYISQDDLTSIYNLATVYCQPSFEEGFGLPVIDAMACACPVAVSQTSALIELTKANAFLFDPNSVKSIKKTLTEAMTNKNKQKQFSQKGMVRAGQYSWQKTAQKTIQIYQSLFI